MSISKNVTATFTQQSTWTWAAGSNLIDAAGVYGSQGQPAAVNTPGSREESAYWTDPIGNLWLFGGYGDDSASGGAGDDFLGGGAAPEDR